jgi:hypothetical protein
MSSTSQTLIAVGVVVGVATALEYRRKLLGHAKKSRSVPAQDEVESASFHSFPASDARSWTPVVSVGGPNR